jgi:hypothetical protein
MGSFCSMARHLAAQHTCLQTCDPHAALQKLSQTAQHHSSVMPGAPAPTFHVRTYQLVDRTVPLPCRQGKQASQSIQPAGQRHTPHGLMTRPCTVHRQAWGHTRRNKNAECQPIPYCPLLLARTSPPCPTCDTISLLGLQAPQTSTCTTQLDSRRPNQCRCSNVLSMCAAWGTTVTQPHHSPAPLPRCDTACLLLAATQLCQGATSCLGWL